MVKPNTLAYFVAQLHTCLHAEPDTAISHIIALMIGNCQSVLHAANTVKRLSANYVLKYHSIHAYQSTERTGL